MPKHSHRGPPGRSADTGWNPCRVVLSLLALYCATVANGAEWEVETLDPTGGMYSSMQFDVYGNAHVAYLDPSRHELRYAFWDHGLKNWFTTDVDQSGGFCSLALDSHQRPHISYHDFAGKLKHASWNGASWDKQE